MVAIKQLPNIISVVRTFLSLALLFLYNSPIQFMIVYFLCGLSDVLDGYTARRYQWETTVGEKLDSFSDFVFYMVVLYLLIVSGGIIDQIRLLLGIGLVVLIRGINFIITKIKFNTWGALHSWANKITGLLIYIYIPFAIVNAEISFAAGMTLCIIALLSSVEETAILLSAGEYDANRKSYFKCGKSI